MDNKSEKKSMIDRLEDLMRDKKSIDLETEEQIDVTFNTKDAPKKRTKTNSSVEKWGLAGISFTQVPNILLDNKKRLELNDSEFLLLLHLMKYWWGDSRLPFPSKSTLAKVMGKDERQIQRILKSLENKSAPLNNEWSDKPGYITRIDNYDDSGKRRSNHYDLSKLKNALKCLAIEIENAKEQVNKKKPTLKPKTKPPQSVSLRAKGYI